MDDWSKLIRNKELARIIGELTGDGHLQHKGWRHQVSFYSKNINEIENMNKRIFNLFNLKGKIHIYKKSSKKVPKATVRYGIFFNSKELAKFLYEAGLPKGNKTRNIFQIPEWIMIGSDEIKSAYLRGLFDTDGEIHQEKKTFRWLISLEQYKSEDILEQGIIFMQQIKELLNSLNIITSPVRKNRYNIRNDGTKSVGLKLSIEEKGFENFYKYIGFNNIKKKEKLIEWTRGQTR